jgi:nonsense-mediated mRNA decay protein 3
LSFCVKCGIDIDETINGLCIDCFLEGRKLTVFPHHVDVQRCANCGEFHLNDNWTARPLIDVIEDSAINSLSAVKEARVVDVAASTIEQDPYNYVVTVESTLDINGYRTEDSGSTIVRIKNTVCKRCSRQLGNYYESILQIRTGEKELSEFLKGETLLKIDNFVNAQSKTNRQIFITKIEQVPGGIDAYLSSIALGKALAKSLGDAYCAETNEAAKLVGQTDDGQDMYRVTYLVRLPEYHTGDVIILDGRYYKLTRVAGSGGKVIDLMDFRERAVKRIDMPNIKVHEKGENLRDASVISRSDNEIQVLHPANYSTVDLKVPEGSDVGDIVKVTEIDDTLYFVP